MRNRYRLLTIALSFAMLLAFMPTLAFAAAEAPESTDATLAAAETAVPEAPGTTLAAAEAEIDYNLPDEIDALTGETVSIFKEAEGSYQKGDDYESFTYKIKSVTVTAGGTTLKLNEDSEQWNFVAKDGANVVKMTYYLFDPASGKMTEETAEHTYTVKAVKELYNVGISSNSFRIAPGETIVFVAQGYHSRIGSDGFPIDDYNFNYVWKVNKGFRFVEKQTIVTSEDNSETTLTLKIKNDVNLSEFKSGDVEALVSVSIVNKSNSSSVFASEESQFFVSNSYDVFVPGIESQIYLKTGGETTFTPVVMHHAYTEKGKPVSVAPSKNTKYMIQYEPANLEIRQGSEIVTPGMGADDPSYDGPFTVKKLDGTDTDFSIFAWRDEGDGPDNIGSSSVWVFPIGSFNSSGISGVADKAYNGKARTQDALSVTAEDPNAPGEPVALFEGTDYVLKYKNNVKVGTATVEVVGILRYEGSKVTKTFKINPAKPTVNKLTAGKKSLTVKMSKKASGYGASGFEIQYRIKGKSKWKSVKTAKQSRKIKKLKKGKKYQVRVRAYKKVSGKTYKGAWSKTKTSAKIK